MRSMHHHRTAALHSGLKVQVMTTQIECNVQTKDSMVEEASKQWRSLRTKKTTGDQDWV